MLKLKLKSLKTCYNSFAIKILGPLGCLIQENLLNCGRNMFFLKIKQMDRDGGPKKESEVKLYISREHKLRRNTKNN